MTNPLFSAKIYGDWIIWEGNAVKKTLCALLIVALALAGTAALAVDYGWSPYATPEPIYDPDAPVPINATNFPDEVFRGYVLDQCDTDGDGMLSKEEIAAVTTMSLYGLKRIQSLTGIEYFTELRGLACGYHKLSYLNLTKNLKLEFLECERNQLSTLVLTGLPSIRYVLCGGNPWMQSLYVNNTPSLQVLLCAGNALGILDVSGCPALEQLYCSGNTFPSLYIENNPELQVLVCGFNSNLWNLIITGAPRLRELDCSDAKELEKLDVTTCPLLMATISTENETVAGRYVTYDDGVGKLRMNAGVKLNGGEAPTFARFPESLKTLDAEALSDTSVQIVELTEAQSGCAVGSRAFADCERLACVRVTGAGITFAPDAFEGIDRLVLCTDQDDVAEWALAQGVPCCHYHDGLEYRFYPRWEEWVETLGD